MAWLGTAIRELGAVKYRKLQTYVDFFSGRVTWSKPPSLSEAVKGDYRSSGFPRDDVLGFRMVLAS